MTYWTSHVSERQAENVSNALATVLKQILTDPLQPVSELNLLSLGAYNQILDWNLPVPAAVENRIDEIFRRRAVETPDALALCSTAVEYTYKQLDELSTRLANHLLELGVGPEIKVPLCFERSTWAVVSMLAILKAGGCMVPLEPSHPMERLKMILNDVDARIILSSRQHASRWAEITGRFVVVDDMQMRTWTNLTPITTRTRSHNAAYIIFTSGTTGKPKGSVIQHSAFASNAGPMAKALHMSSSTRTVQFMSYGFDGCLAEILTPLLAGGCVCIPSDAEKSNNITEFMTRMRVNWASFTPSFARLFSPSELPTLQTLCLVGEAMSKDDISTWSAHLTLVNGYGPTECSICASVNPRVSAGSSPANIGRAVGGTAWIVHPDDHNRLQPLGCPGELLVAGPTLAREYLHNPEKTTEVFVSGLDWFQSKHGAASTRFYKTGDLARYNSDGSLSFCGRKDSQVKLRGQRLELGEVEFHVKNNLPGVKRVVVQVVSRSGSVADQQLVAFLCFLDKDEEVTNDHDIGALDMSTTLATTIRSLASSLGNLLPSYMVPSMFVPINRFPLTSAGKIDARAMQKLVRNLSGSSIEQFSLASTEKRAPTTAMEEKLLSMWEEILPSAAGLIGIDDSFFHRGGDSIAAIKLVAAARRADISISVAEVFSHPTIAKLALLASDNIEGEHEVGIETFSLVPASVRETLSRSVALADKSILDMFPCTPMQEALMALSMKASGSYVLQNAFSLSPDVDIPRYMVAWKSLVHSFSILRTRILHHENTSYQVVVEEEPSLQTVSTSLQDYLKKDQEKSMGYGDALSRYALVQDGGDRYLVWTVHHAIYDGFSMQMITSALKAAYETQSAPAEPPTFARYVQHISNVSQDEADQFWTSQLSGSTHCNFPRLPSATHQICASITSTQLMSLERREAVLDITPSTILRAAWGLLLALYTGSSDVVFGATVTGRDVSMQRITELAGPTITTVPVRLQLDWAQTTLDYLSAVQGQTVSMIPYQHVGIRNISRLSSECQLACDFRSLFVIQPMSRLEDLIQGVSHVSLGRPNFHTYPLEMECFLADNSVHVAAQYDPAILSAAEVDRVLGQLNHIVQQLCSANDQTALLDMDLVSPPDHASLATLNATYPERVALCAHDVFQAQVRAQPDALAISSWDGEFTYRQVDNFSTRLAAHLVESGLQTGTIVPLCFEKSSWAIVSMLAVSKAGGAFVLLDPQNPISRLRSIVAQTKASLILTSTDCARLWESEDTNLIRVNANFVHSLSSSSVVPAGRATPDDVLYVIFTSGSTGTPKGCVIEHGAFLTSSASYTEKIGMDRTCRVLQFCSYSFDASIIETLSAVTVGACICISSREPKAEGLADVITRTRATWAFLTPSVVKLIRPSDVPSLKTLMLGGEALSQESIQVWSREVKLINAYGPSECAIVSSVQPQITLDTSSTNIGYASGGRCWVVDAKNHDRLVPIGCPGELLIEGHLLARGYLGRDDLTDAAFIVNPAWTGSASETRRFYKTGDLVRYNQDLSLHFIGRKDSQIKLRGQRIELGEIEQQMMAQHAVKNAIAILPKTGHYLDRIVAVVLLKDYASDVDPPLQIIPSHCKEAASAQIGEIRQALSNTLPSYMVPTVWVAVSVLPLSISGKLDRLNIQRWLEQADATVQRQIESISGVDSMQAPQSAREKMLHEICCQVLNLQPDKVGINYSFVGLGGDSITAMQFVSRCRAGSISLALKDILSNKTLAQLAELMTVEQEEADTVSREEEFDTNFKLAPVQQMYFEMLKYQGDDGGDTASTRFNQSFFLRVNRPIQPESMASALDQIVQRHSMLRARYSRNLAGGLSQMIPSVVQGSYSFAVSAAETEQAMMQEMGAAQRRLEAQTGPVFAAILFDNNVRGNGQLLFLVAHHLVIDLMSWRIILGDLETILTTKFLPSPKPLPFQTWTRLQDEYSSRELSPAKAYNMSFTPADLDYWGMKGVSNTYGATKSEGFVLDARQTADLLGASHHALRTDVVDVLLGSVFASFRDTFTGRDGLTVFVEGHGREPWDAQLDISTTVGWFTTVSPMHVPLSPADDLVTAVRKAKDTRRRVPGNGWPYMASRYSNREGRQAFGNYGPAEILFNYMGRYQQFEQADALFSQEKFDWQPPSPAADVGDQTPRWSLIEISAVVDQGCLEVSFNYSTKMKHAPEIRRWIDTTQSRICEAITELTNLGSTATLSDFPGLKLTYDGLSQLLAETMPRMGLTSWQQIESLYPCSPVQSAMLISHQTGSENYRTWSISSVRHSGGVQLDCLQQAWQKVVDRHPVLRTLFVDSLPTEEDSGVFHQVVVKDLRARVLSITASDDEAVDVLRNQTPMALLQDAAPHQLTLCKTPTRSLIKLEMSHTIVDGGSMDLVFRELCDAYDSRLSQGPGFAYGDYIAHLEQQKIAGGGSLDHWKTYLADTEPCLLPTMETEQPNEGPLHSRDVELSVQVQSLLAFCDNNHITLANLIQAAWAMVLRSYTHSDQVCFGYAASGRDIDLDGLEHAVGPFINVLVCSVAMSSSSTPLELAKTIQQEYIDGLAHQHVSLAEILHALGMAEGSLFNTAISIQRIAPVQHSTSTGLSLEGLEHFDPSEVGLPRPPVQTLDAFDES